MEHPAREVATIIETLAKGSPREQADTLNNYFLPNASFTHPFCRVPSFSQGAIPFAKGIDSRWLILGIYRWYRTLSPHIDLRVDSSAFDQRSGLLYVSIHQTFSVWFIPLYKAPVKLVTVLQLIQKASSEHSQAATRNRLPDGRGSATLAGPGQERVKYFIASQEDLYQANDCVQFVLPSVGPLLWFFWQLCSAGLCVLGSLLFLPMYHFLNRNPAKKTN